MSSRAIVVSSVWIAVAAISVVYMLVFADKIGDVLFGVFLPIGLLVLVAAVVTVIVFDHEHGTNESRATHFVASEV